MSNYKNEQVFFLWYIRLLICEPVFYKFFLGLPGFSYNDPGKILVFRGKYFINNNMLEN